MTRHGEAHWFDFRWPETQWSAAMVSGSLITLALFMALPSLRFAEDELEEPVIVVDFMQWREPKPLPAKQQEAPSQPPRPVIKPKTPPKQADVVKQQLAPPPKPEPVIDPEPQTQLPEEIPALQPEPVTAEPEQFNPPPQTEQFVESDALPEPVPLFKLTSLPRFARKTEPEYPPSMRALGKEASVKLEVLIDRKGVVRNVTVLQSGGKAFDDAATAALMASSFVPGNIEGQPVAVRMRIPIKFSLR